MPVSDGVVHGLCECRRQPLRIEEDIQQVLVLQHEAELVLQGKLEDRRPVHMQASCVEQHNASVRLHRVILSRRHEGGREMRVWPRGDRFGLPASGVFTTAIPLFHLKSSAYDAQRIVIGQLVLDGPPHDLATRGPIEKFEVAQVKVLHEQNIHVRIQDSRRIQLMRLHLFHLKASAYDQARYIHATPRADINVREEIRWILCLRWHHISERQHVW
mmetsp:Transcript_40392/g.108185  ORF Transcript_40392/g.108185 Transcript_40392/m.108185 type:complete len:216 (+) Transcript_40392:413-1060(+)